MLPEDSQIASYLFSEKVNYLAHVNVGKRQRGLCTARTWRTCVHFGGVFGA
jgi:hypothetical protein